MITDLLVFLEFHSKWIFAILVYQTFLLSIIFFYYGRWSKSRPKLILSLFMLISGIIFLAFLFQHTGRIRLSGTLNILLPAGFLTLMPFAYIFLRAKTNKKFKTWINEQLHFIPAALIFLINIGFAFSSQSVKLNLMNSPQEPLFYTIMVQAILWSQFIYYSYRSILLLKEESNVTVKKKSFSAGTMRQKKWQILLFVSFGLFSFVMALMVLDSMLYNKATDDIILYIISFIIITLLIVLFDIKIKDITAGRVAFANINHNPVYSTQVLINEQLIHDSHHNDNNNKNKPALTSEKREELIKAFHDLMLEKIYTDPDFSLDMLAKKMNSNTKYVSLAIHESTGKPFTDYVNELRINEARKLLNEDKKGIYSIEGIGKTVGFQSKSTFNTHFKKLTGMTPSEYKTVNG